MKLHFDIYDTCIADHWLCPNIGVRRGRLMSAERVARFVHGDAMDAMVIMAAAHDGFN